MKTTLLLSFLFLSPLLAHCQVKEVLLTQLKNTHDQKAWFEPAKGALAELKESQVIIKDSTANHSIRELASHVLFWTETNLKGFKGEQANMPSTNEVTFTHYDTIPWDDLVLKLDSVQTEWETEVKAAKDDYLNGWSTPIANMCTHTAYHTGQIMFIRKQNGWW